MSDDERSGLVPLAPLDDRRSESVVLETKPLTYVDLTQYVVSPGVEHIQELFLVRHPVRTYRAAA